MTLDTAIAFFRRARERQFRSEGVVTRVTADGTFNATTGAIGSPTTSTIYDGACNVREMAWEGTDVTTGEREVRTRRAALMFPHDTEIVENDVLTVTASDEDASLVGKTFRITDVFLDAWQTVRRATGEKVSS